MDSFFHSSLLIIILCLFVAYVKLDKIQLVPESFTKHEINQYFRVRVMVFNATFNNISIISWWSVLLVEETGVPGENHRPVASH